MNDKVTHLSVLNSLRIHASDDHTFYCDECIAFKTFKTHECHTCSQYLAKISADLIEQLIADETTHDKRKTPSLFECEKMRLGIMGHLHLR